MKSTFVSIAIAVMALQSNAAIQPTNFKLNSVSSDVVVAVIDTGADISHPELRKNIWTNPGEFGLDLLSHDKATNGIDDDDNGFVDDLHGWNFVTNTPQVEDTIGHGTHITGIIKNSAEKNIKLMILKYFDPAASDAQNINNTVRALNYAINMKVKIINYSGGGSTPNPAEFAALKRAESNNIVLVAAAGNNNNDTNQLSYYPANYGLKNIISVAATNQSGELVKFSNYGSERIDIAAPGERIFSTLPGHKYGYMSGTSQSTAFVTGSIARQLASASKFKNYDELLYRLLDQAQFNSSLKGKTKYQLALLSSIN